MAVAPGSGSVAVTLPGAISAGSIIAIACAVVQTNGSGSTQPDRTRHYCILDEAGNVMLEQSLPTTPKGIHQVFSRIPRSRIALETGTHSPWVSRS